MNKSKSFKAVWFNEEQVKLYNDLKTSGKISNDSFNSFVKMIFHLHIDKINSVASSQRRE